MLFDFASGLGGNLGAPGAVNTEYHVSKHRCGRVVHMHDSAGNALQCLKRALDEMAAGLRHDLNRHVIGNRTGFDKFAHVIKVGLRSGGKAYFDFLETDLDQQVEETTLAFGIHRLDQGLIAIAHIDAAPARRNGLDPAGPCAIRQIHGGEMSIFAGRILQHHGVYPF
ncbi:hypothetical protein D3C78_1219230 [compost metagenome]